MRKLVVLMLLSVLFACDDDDKGENVVLADPGTMKMTLDGVEMVSSTTKVPVVLYDAASAVVSFNVYFPIPSNATDYYLMNLTIKNPKVGDFDLLGNGFVSGNSSAMYVKPDPKMYISYHVSESKVGKIELTKFDVTNKLMSGTFEVKVAAGPGGETLLITSGSFTDIQLN